METSIYRFILRYSKREQVVLLILTGLSFPFLYYSLDLPKRIINEALDPKEGAAAFPVSWLGFELGQIEYLWTLSGLFLALVCINGGFKYAINVYRGQLGERMLRRLRFELYARVLRFPLGRFRRMSQGEIIPMVTAEVEPLGGFIGDSISLPAFQGGTLITILFFMFMQDPVLGLAAISLYPVQAYVIPKLQRQVNLLAKERVRTVRALSDKLGESVSGVQEIHANDAARLMLSRFSQRLGRIYEIRFEIYKKKFFIKFLNNFLAQITPFFFYAIGGYLVIRGDLSLGAMVAVLAAYKDLSAPWKELLGYYERKEDARIKYEQVVEQFDAPGSLDPAHQATDDDDTKGEPAGFRSSNLGWVDDDGDTQLDGINLRIEAGERVALLGPTNGGKEALTLVLARLASPTTGSLTFAGRDIATLPEAVTGRRIGYVGPSAFVFSTTIRENLLLGAMHRPLATPQRDESEQARAKRFVADAAVSGNATDDPLADWVDYEAIGVADGAALSDRLVDLLEVVDLQDDCYLLGLRGALDPERRPEAASRLLAKNANEVLGTPDDDLAWQCANEPPVPTLCLSSPIDPVVPQKGIYAFGERLVAAQPTRSVRHASISAPHCQLADKEPKAYADELQRLLDQADRLCKVPPLADVSDATANPSPTPSTASVVAAAGASSKAMPTESETMASVLAVYELSDVAGLIDPATIDLAAAFALLDTGGRVELLNQLKLAGLTKLSDRQKVANALGKQHRLRASA